MSINSKGACPACRPAAGGKPQETNLEPIGTPVLIETSVARGKDRTNHSFFQCLECGSVWVELEDSGAGGHGRFWRRLTEEFF